MSLSLVNDEKNLSNKKLLDDVKIHMDFAIGVNYRSL